MGESAGSAAGRRPFYGLLSRAFEAEGRRVPTVLTRRSVATEDDGAPAEPLKASSTLAPAAADEEGPTSPGWGRGLMADPLSESVTDLRRLECGGSAAESLVGEREITAVRERGGVTFLPPRELSDPEQPASGWDDGGFDLDVSGLDDPDNSEPLPVIVGVPADEATDGLCALGDALGVVVGALEGESTEPDHELPVWAVPEKTVTLDAETLRQLHAQILSSLEPLPGPATLHDVPRAALFGAGDPSAALDLERRPAPSASSPPVVDDGAVLAAQFTLTGLNVARPTASGPEGDLSRKAHGIFEAAMEDFRAGRLGAAHTNAMLARVYDPDHDTYRRAAAWWGYLHREARAGRRVFVASTPAEATRRRRTPAGQVSDEATA